jgi:hypothetical protein
MESPNNKSGILDQINQVSDQEQATEIDSYILDYCKQIAVKTGIVIGLPAGLYLIQSPQNNDADNFSQFLRIFNTYILFTLATTIGKRNLISEIHQDITTLSLLMQERLNLSKINQKQ